MPVRNYYLWYEAPFLRLLPPLVVGIICYLLFSQLPLWLIILTAIISLMGLISFPLLSLKQRFRFSWMSGLLISILLIALGSWFTYHNDIRKNKISIGHKQFKDQDYLIAKLKEVPVEKEKTFKAIAQLQYLIDKADVQEIKGNVLLYFPKNSISTLNAGSKLIIPANALEKIKPPANPASFDYAAYCHKQQIYYQAFLKKDNWKTLASTSPPFFQNLINRSRRWCLNNIDTYINDPKANAIAKALIIGDREEIDPQLKQDYINAGVVHLIAISGLHLGIIYILLLFILRWLPKKRKGNFIRAIIIIAGLWFFALLTGGRSSVIRAAVMFSFIEAGNSLLSRRMNIYNSLAAAAFLLLCFNPYRLTQVGFQLSFAAVLSIVIFQPLLARLYYSKYLLVKYAWELLCTSAAAQILTFPISIYYFHQFPLFFLAANMIAIPLVVIIVYSLVLMLAISFIPLAAHAIAYVVIKLISCLNSWISFVANIHFAIWNNIFLNFLQLLLIYLLITALFYFIINKKRPAIIYFLSLFCLFNITVIVHFLKIREQKKIVVYDIPYHQAVDIINGNKAFFLGDSSLDNDNYALANSRQYYHISQLKDHLVGLYFHQSFLDYHSKKIIILDKKIQKQIPLRPLKVDYLLLGHNLHMQINEIVNYFSASEIIFDASNPPWKIQKWKSECNRLNLLYFSVPDKGAFIFNL